MLVEQSSKFVSFPVQLNPTSEGTPSLLNTDGSRASAPVAYNNITQGHPIVWVPGYGMSKVQCFLNHILWISNSLIFMFNFCAKLYNESQCVEMITREHRPSLYEIYRKLVAFHQPSTLFMQCSEGYSIWFFGVFLSTVYAYCGTLYTLVLETNVLKRYSVKKQCIITGLPRPGFICSAHRGGIIITVCIESIGAQNAITVTVRLGSQYVALSRRIVRRCRAARIESISIFAAGRDAAQRNGAMHIVNLALACFRLLCRELTHWVAHSRKISHGE